MATIRNIYSDSLLEDPERIVKILLLGFGVVIFAWHLYYAFFTPMDRTQHSNIHLGLLLVVFYLGSLNFDGDGGRRQRYMNISSAVLAILTGVLTMYVHLNFYRWLNEAQALLRYNNTDLFVGILLIVIATHATWRAYGKVLGLVVAGSLFYGIAGPYFPGLLGHSGISVERLIYMNSVSLNGVYGFLLGISATWIIGFIIFAGIVEAYGGMEYVIRVGTNIGSYMRSGVLQVAVVASMAMGSITGSSAANVATTGSFTIPLMMDNGVKGRFAGAIESVASTGGQMLPPVMGSAAFIMADILGISYYEVIRGAILPALLFYVSSVATVHLTALRHGWTTDKSDMSFDSVDTTSDQSLSETKSGWDNFLEGLPYLISLGVLLYTLVILRYDPMTAAMWTIITLLGVGLIRSTVRNDSLSESVRVWLAESAEGMRIGAVNMAPLTAVLASLGIVIRVLTSSGFTQRFSLQIISLAGGVFIAILLVTMVASILFGLGMPTPAAYVVVATLTAPVLVQVGVGQLTAHIFVFYFALLSTITPPVALSCAVASGISGSTFMATAKETVRLGSFAFLIPFVFVVNDNLIYWEGISTFVAFVAISVGLISLSVAVVGHDGGRSIPSWGRIVFAAIAFGIFFLPLEVAQIGLAIGVTVWLARNLLPSRIRGNISAI